MHLSAGFICQCQRSLERDGQTEGQVIGTGQDKSENGGKGQQEKGKTGEKKKREKQDEGREKFHWG